MARLRFPSRLLAVAAMCCTFLLPASPVHAQVAAGVNVAFGKNKVRYEKFDWKVYHSPHFDVYYYMENEAYLERVISFAESAYDRLSRELDYQIQDPTPLILYNTHAEFLQNNIILNFIPEGVAAFATSARFRMVMPVDLPDDELLELIAHELTHIFQYYILFGGSRGKAVTTTAPQWLMEGMASYFGQDESTSDKMFLRDGVVNDSIPQMTQGGVGGFLAYRYGHAVFDFIEERWGREGLMDFLFEFRNTLGGRIGRAVERTFRMTPEDFDAEFRRWLRQKYLPELISTGEPGDFGRPFRVANAPRSQQSSPVASPSGDLVAAFTTHKADLDVALFDAENRTLLRNLTKGYSSNYQFLEAQFLTDRRRMGRDIAFSPDGNTLAVFARREEGRSLVLLNVLKGGVQRIISMDIQQQHAPAWSPDGRYLAFSGTRDGNFDIYLLDLETSEVQNVTQDELFHSSPAFSPDGKSLVISTNVGDYAQLFRLQLEDPSNRYRLTRGDWNDMDAVYSPTGERIYFTSDRGGTDNIYSLDFDSGEIRQYTNAVTGCFTPTVLAQSSGRERLVYTGYWKGRFDLYETEVDEPVGETQIAEIETEPAQPEELPLLEPDVQVILDEANMSTHKGFKLFLEDADYFVGIDDDQTFIGNIVLQFSDFLGDRRLLAFLQSIESFSNFRVIYVDLSKRMQKRLDLFDDRDFFIGVDQRTGQIERGQAAFTQTGVLASINYPFSFYRRGEIGVGYIRREYDFQTTILDPDLGVIPIIQPRKDDYPVVQGALTGDTAVFSSWGPVSGHRYRFTASYAPDLEESGVLTSSLSLDARKYWPFTRRSGFAVRLFAGRSDGNFPDVFYFGGLDTVRGFELYSIVGTDAFFTNLELRFPLIDVLAFPGIAFQGIRGRFFLDVAGAWYGDLQGFRFWNGEEDRLEDAVASYGFGFTIRLFGLNMNWDFSKETDFDTTEDTRTSFWIGQRF